MDKRADELDREEREAKRPFWQDENGQVIDPDKNQPPPDERADDYRGRYGGGV